MYGNRVLFSAPVTSGGISDPNSSCIEDRTVVDARENSRRKLDDGGRQVLDEAKRWVESDA
jgi:hypothetical protein